MTLRALTKLQDGHRIIQNAFQKAKAEAAFLVDRSM